MPVTPTLTDPQVVLWANQRARTLCNELFDLSQILAAYQTDYAQQGIAAKIVAAGASNTLADGSDADGRPQVTGTQLVNLKAAVDQLKTSFETLVSGVGITVTNIASGIHSDTRLK